VTHGSLRVLGMVRVAENVGVESGVISWVVKYKIKKIALAVLDLEMCGKEWWDCLKFFVAPVDDSCQCLQ